MRFLTDVIHGNVFLHVDEEVQEYINSLKPNPNANQKEPRKYYAYGHFNEEGKPFYIGKGTKRRAWSEDRDRFWKRYVNNHLGGKYSVVILEDNLSEEEALELEYLWVRKEGDNLLNWIDGINSDVELEKELYTFQMKHKPHLILQNAQSAEKQEDLNKATDHYCEYLKYRYQETLISRNTRTGLLKKMIDEEIRENGLGGHIGVLNRLTICLIKTNRDQEAIAIAQNYFEKYKADVGTKLGQAVIKRLSKYGGLKL